MQSRYPSLDGLRAIAVVLVIFSHSGISLPGLWRIDVGHLGVRVFFVLSGFLITSLLLRERERTGAIDLTAFYIRRSLRIFPAFYFFLAVMAFMPHDKRLWPAAVYLSDYLPASLSVGHSWSLAVEEQFYLLWAPALILFPRRSTLICLAMLIVSPLWRVGIDLLHADDYARYGFVAVSDGLATGCLLALFRDRLYAATFYRSIVDSFAPLGFLAIALIIFAVKRWYLPDLSMLLNTSIALIIDRYIRHPESVIGRILNFTPIAGLGLISYSLYLWQQPFLFSSLPMAWKVSGTLGCAMASYFFLEKPIRGIRWHRSIAAINRI